MTSDQVSIKRFFAKTTTNHDEWFEGTKCVLWTASHANKSGYGRFCDRSRRWWVAHRFAYELAHGPVPDGMLVGHRCPNKLCVNDLHLEAITPEEMIRRRTAAFTPATHFRCCGLPRTAENMYPGSRQCRACHKVWQRNTPSARRKRRRAAARKVRRAAKAAL